MCDYPTSDTRMPLFRSDYRRGLDWWLYLLTIYRSLLQITITLSLFSTLYKSLAHAKSSQTLLVVSWQRIFYTVIITVSL
jgi:hypothetical protein